MSVVYASPSHTSGDPAVQRSTHLPPGPRLISSGRCNFDSSFGSHLSSLTALNSKTLSSPTPYFGRYMRCPSSTGGDQPTSPEAPLPCGRNSSSPSDGFTTSPRCVTTTARPPSVVASRAPTLL